MALSPILTKPYVEYRDSGYWIGATRISLDSGVKDPDVLAIAARDGRVPVAHDRKTMPTEFGHFITTQTSTGMLVISRNLPIGEAINALILVWEASTAEEWINQIMTFPF